MALNSFAPELCSLICQDPIFKRRDLNAICFISHPFRREAQRVLSYRFPCLRGASRVKSWCLSLQRTPHLALNVQDIILFLPPQQSIYIEDAERLRKALQMCLNLKELSVFSQCPTRPRQSYSSSIHMLFDLPFTLRRFVNGYFDQNTDFASFLQTQTKLETLEMHSLHLPRYVDLPFLKTLACPALWYFGVHCWTVEQLRALRLDFEHSTECREIEILSWASGLGLKNLALFLTKIPDGTQSHLLQIIHSLSNAQRSCVQHLEIHQFLPILEERLVFSSQSDLPEIETLVLRPPPRLPPKKSGDVRKLCAYVNLRTTLDRRKTVENIMDTFKTLTRFVLVDHEYDYEFRRDLKTGFIAEEELITFDKEEWACV